MRIAGLLIAVALAFPLASAVPATPARPVAHQHTEICCCKKSEALPPASCGCRTCPATALTVALFADFTKAIVPAPGFHRIAWISLPQRAESRFAEPLTPPPRGLA